MADPSNSQPGTAVDDGIDFQALTPQRSAATRPRSAPSPSQSRVDDGIDFQPHQNSQASGAATPQDTLSAYEPSLLQRAKNVITQGVPRYSSRTVYNPKYGQTQIVSPEEAMTPGEQQRHPILTGVGEVAGGLTSPENVAIIAASGGLGGLPGAAGRILPRLVSGGFSAQMAWDAYRQVPEFKAALDRGDTAEAERIGTHIAASGVLGYLAGRHAIDGGASAQVAENTEDAAQGQSARPRIPRLLGPAQPVPVETIAGQPVRTRLYSGDQPLITPESARTPQGAIVAQPSPLSARKLLPAAGESLPTDDYDFLAGKETAVPPLRSPVPPGVVEDYKPGYRPAPNPKEARTSAAQSEIDFQPLATPPASTEAAKVQPENATAPAQVPRINMPEPSAPTAADKSAEMQRAANLVFGQLKRNPVEQQYARDVWAARLSRDRSPEPPPGMMLARARSIQSKMADIISGESLPSLLNPDPRTSGQFAPDELEAAHHRLVEASGLLRQATPPGRYENVDESGRGTGHWYGVTSLRTMFPWFADMKETPAELARAIERGEGPAYHRLLQSAAEYEQSSRETTRSIVQSVAPDIDQLVEQVRGMDPELAQVLSDAGAGKLGVFDGSLSTAREWAERHIKDARQVASLASSIAELAEAERSESASATSAEESSGAARRAREESGQLPPRELDEGTFYSGVDPTRIRTAMGVLGRAWQDRVALPFIDRVLRIGDKYQKAREADPAVAEGLHLLDNAPQYLRQKAAQHVHDIVGGLSRDQERLFTLLADADSRENLRENHPEEYRRAMSDPAIQQAVRTYRPLDRELSATRQKLGGDTLEQDYLRRVYDKYVAGIGKEQAPASGERASSASDRVIRPQRIGTMSREASAEFHYQNGLHEFGPAFATKFIGTNLRSLRDTVAKDFLSKATKLPTGAPEPRFILYDGGRYFRPDIAANMPRDTKVYDRYDPTAGEKFPQPVDGKFLGPREVVRALSDYGRHEENEPSALRRWFQEQVIGFGFGIPHVANILRRVTQNAAAGALNPKGWADAWKVAFDKGLRERGIRGLDDPTFDKLARQGAISTGEMAQLKEYWGGNLNPANWTRALAQIGHKVLYEPGSTGGFGGIDQRARIYLADLVQSQRPDLSDEQVGRHVRDALGDYNRANWSDQQKMLSRFMLFPGWDFSSVRWVLQHPIRTTLPPALIVLLANQALHKAEANRAEDATDIQNIHVGDRTIGPGLVRESVARNLFRPFINYAQAKLQDANEQRAQAAAARGVTGGAGGLLGMLRPDLSGFMALATNRQGLFSSREIVGSGDWETPGKILPSRALEKQAVFTVRHAIPALDRMLDSGEDLDVRGFVGGNLSMPNYREDAETRLGRNAAEAQQVFQAISKTAKQNPVQAREMMKDPDNAAYALFHRDFQSIVAAKNRLDQARQRIEESGMPEAEKQDRLRALDASRQTLLGHAESLNNLLFERRQQPREPMPRLLPPQQYPPPEVPAKQ